MPFATMRGTLPTWSEVLSFIHQDTVVLLNVRLTQLKQF